MPIKIEQLNVDLEKTKKAILKFKKERREFDKIIETYNKFRDKNFNQERKQEYIESKNKIKELEKEIMTLKSQKTMITPIIQ